MTALRSTDLIGRDAELESLSRQLGIRASGSASGGASTGAEQRAVLLAGDAGVGKTRLLMALRDAAVAEGWQVVAGHCLDLADSSLPYLPFSEILGRLMSDQPDACTRVMERHPVLARLQPGRRLRSEGTTNDHALDRANVYDAVQDLLYEASAEAPLLVVVEDAHWADESTRDTLSFLFSRPTDHPVSIVVSYRADDLHRRHPLRRQVAEWARLRDLGRVHVEPLPDEAVRRLVKELRPATLTEAELGSIVDRAEGNPFFVEELAGASWSDHMPWDLADVLLVRLDRLDDTARNVVRLVSVAGRQVGHHLLAAVSDLDDAALEAGLRSAVEANVLEASRRGTYAFRHALLGEAVYDDLLPGERTRLHAAFAAALDEGRAAGTAAELAQHARLAGDRDTALRASIEAGEEAMAVGGAAEAASLFVDALELAEGSADPSLDRSALVRRCAGALTASGRVSKAVKVLRARLDELPEDASPDDRGQLLTALASALLLTDSTESPTEVAAQAVGLLRAGSPKLLARALAVHAHCLGTWSADEARVVAMEAMELADKHNLTSVAVDVTTTMVALEKPGRGDDAVEAWLAAADKAHRAGRFETELRARYLVARVLQDRGELATAAQSYVDVIRRGEELGTPWAPFPAEARWLRASALTQLGRLGEAYALLDVSGQQPPLTYEWLYFAQQTLIDVGLRGGDRHPDAFAALRPHWHRDGLLAIVSATTEVMHAERTGDPAAALEAYDRAVGIVTPMWHEWFQARLRLSASVVGVYATAAALRPGGAADGAGIEAEVGSVTRLMADGERVMDFYAQYDDSRGPEHRAWVARRTAEHLRWRWLVQHDPPEAEELVAAWRAAEEAFCLQGEVPEIVRTRVRLASVLRATGDRAGAREVAAQARSAAVETTASALVAEVDALALAVAESVPDTGRPALTPREGEILALVEQGRTNGEIGRQLFISTKTVSVHVSNILGKLGASSRTEAAAIARRDELV